MQILPANDILNNMPVPGGSDANGNIGDLFADILDVQSGVTAKEQAEQSLRDESRRHAEDAARETALREDLERGLNDSSRAAQEELVTAEDFAEVRTRLEEMGVPSGDLDELQHQVEEGMTWKEMGMALERLALGTAAEGVQLSGQDRAHLTNMLKKMGFHPSQAAGLVHSLGRGESGAVLQAIKGRLDALPDGAKLNLTQAELATLGKTLKLSDQGMATLRAFANGMGGQGAFAQDVRNLMTMLAQEAEGGLNVATRMQDIQKLMDDMLKKVREKAMGEAKADRLGEDESGKWLRANKDDWAAGTAKERLHKDGGQDLTDEFADDMGRDKDGRADNLREMFKDLKVKHGVADVQAERQALGLLAERAPGDLGAERAAQLKGNGQQGRFTALDAQTRQAVFQQVQSAVITSMKGEVQQMSLQLQPEHLGAVQLTLVARDKDVAGVIRADSPEAARAIAENMAELRSALEREGLRVNSLEVETRTAGGDRQFGNQWNNPDGHNFMQDMQQRARNLRLAALRNSAQTTGSEPAAQAAPRKELLAEGRVSLIA